MKNRLQHIKDEVVWCLKTFVEPRSSWIYLPIVLAVSTVYLASSLNAQWYLAKGGQETTALILLGCAIAALTVASARMKSLPPLFLLVLCVNFLIRELDHQIITIPSVCEFEVLSKKYIYVALAFIGAWGFWKEEGILPFFNKHLAVKRILLSMTLTYFMSQLIARRIFKHISILPNEHHMHIPLEEITENFAHTMFLVAALAMLALSFKKEPDEKTRQSDQPEPQ